MTDDCPDCCHFAYAKKVEAERDGLLVLIAQHEAHWRAIGIAPLGGVDAAIDDPLGNAGVIRAKLIDLERQLDNCFEDRDTI